MKEVESLELKLDKEVAEYVGRVEGTEEIGALLGDGISLGDYIRLLKTCYVIEHLSQKAVLMASEQIEDSNPYLSGRFKTCAKGEDGHAEIALRDLKTLGVDGVDLSDIPHAEDYESMLQDTAQNFPLGILGHSYLFESASAVMFPKHNGHDYTSEFILVHAKEDPGHSLALKRTVRRIEPELSDDDKENIARFARESGEYLLRIFQEIQG